MAAEEDLAVRGRSEAEDNAAAKKERRKAVSSGLKPRRRRGPRDPRAPGAPKARRAPRAGGPAGGRGGSSGRGGDGGRKPQVSSPAAAAVSAATEPGPGPEPEPSGKEDFGGLSADADFIDDSGLEAVAPGAVSAQSPRAPSDSSGEFLTQSPLSTSMLLDSSLSGTDPDGSNGPRKGTAHSPPVPAAPEVASLASAAPAKEAESEGDDTQSESGEARKRIDVEAFSPQKQPKPGSQASGAVAAAAGEQAGGGKEGCEPAVLEAVLIGMGVEDDDVVQGTGRHRLEALLREAGGERDRAVGLYFERQNQKVSAYVCLPAGGRPGRTGQAGCA